MAASSPIEAWTVHGKAQNSSSRKGLDDASNAREGDDIAPCAARAGSKPARNHSAAAPEKKNAEMMIRSYDWHSDQGKVQYRIYSDLGKVQARHQPWYRPSTLHGQVMKLPPANSLPDHNQYSMLESSMALTNAGMTPSINGDSIKARSPTAVGGTNDDSLDHWGFNAEGHSSYTGSDPMFMHNSHARRRSDPRVTNPYIEMRRKRTDMRLFRQHLTSFGSLPQRNPELDESRFQRIRTPDREHCLNISQLASDLPPDPSFVLNFPTLSLESRANYLGLNNRERSRLSARALAESLGLDVNKRVRASNMRLRTPELPTYLSRRRLDAARDDSPKEGSAGSLDTRHSGLKLARVLIPSSEGMRPRVIDRAATTSSTGRRPSINDGSSELQPSLQPLQPFLYPLQTQDGISSQKQISTAPPRQRVSCVAASADSSIAQEQQQQQQQQQPLHPRRQQNPLSHPLVTSSLGKVAPRRGYLGKRNSLLREGERGLKITIDDASMSPWDGGLGEQPSPSMFNRGIGDPARSPGSKQAVELSTKQFVANQESRNPVLSSGLHL